MTEDEMFGWNQRLMDMSLSKLQEIVKDREALECCSPCGCKELDMTATEQ